MHLKQSLVFSSLRQLTLHGVRGKTKEYMQETFSKQTKTCAENGKCSYGHMA